MTIPSMLSWAVCACALWTILRHISKKKGPAQTRP